MPFGRDSSVPSSIRPILLPLSIPPKMRHCLGFRPAVVARGARFPAMRKTSYD